MGEPRLEAACVRSCLRVRPMAKLHMHAAQSAASAAFICGEGQLHQNAARCHLGSMPTAAAELAEQQLARGREDPLESSVCFLCIVAAGRLACLRSDAFVASTPSLASFCSQNAQRPEDSWLMPWT